MTTAKETAPSDTNNFRTHFERTKGIEKTDDKNHNPRHNNWKQEKSDLICQNPNKNNSI